MTAKSSLHNSQVTEVGLFKFRNERNKSCGNAEMRQIKIVLLVNNISDIQSLKA